MCWRTIRALIDLLSAFGALERKHIRFQVNGKSPSQDFGILLDKGHDNYTGHSTNLTLLMREIAWYLTRYLCRLISDNLFKIVKKETLFTQSLMKNEIN